MSSKITPGKSCLRSMLQARNKTNETDKLRISLRLINFLHNYSLIHKKVEPDIIDSLVDSDEETGALKIDLGEDEHQVKTVVKRIVTRSKTSASDGYVNEDASEYMPVVEVKVEVSLEDEDNDNDVEEDSVDVNDDEEFVLKEKDLSFYKNNVKEDEKKFERVTNNAACGNASDVSMIEVKVEVESDNDNDSGDDNDEADVNDNDSERADLVCKKCWLKFSRIQEYRTHLEECDIELSCPNCCAVFPDHDAFTEHVGQCGSILNGNELEEMDDVDITALDREVDIDDLEIATCTVCSSMFMSQEGLKTHMTFCQTQRAFTCRKCRKSFDNRQALMAHTCPEKRIFSCGMCGKVFQKCHVLKGHMKIHANERDHVCPVCSKAFIHKHQLKNHMGMHEHDRRYKCTECDNSYKYYANLRKHKQTHLGKEKRKLYFCQYCNHAFFTNDHKKRHEESNCRMNDCLRKFQCDKCSASFKIKYALAKHMRVHVKGSTTSKRMVECDQCEQKYFIKRHLKEHMKNAHGVVDLEESESEDDKTRMKLNDTSDEHDDDEDEVDKISNVEKIMKNLKKKGQFECKDCDRVFRSAGNLNRHMSLMHDQ